MQDDPFSRSTPSLFTTKHIFLDWTIDFNRQCLSGSCTLEVERVVPPAADQPHAGLLILDCTLLTVIGVTDDDDDGKTLEVRNQHNRHYKFLI